MTYHPIHDFVLSITTSNVVWWDKNVKTTFQEDILNLPKISPLKRLE
jgi:hypothetical protein